MLLYADENFTYPVVEKLRQLGHDVLTAQEDGNVSTPDPDILARAHQLGRVVLTHNRRHFERLHRQGMDHSGIVSVKNDPGNDGPVAGRVDTALTGKAPGRWALRVIRPQKP
jgi:hypothetical protein